MNLSRTKHAGHKVVYIVGLGYSGTTFLQYLLSSFPGTISVGEAHKLGERALAAQQLPPCSCGEEVSHCPLWSRLLPTRTSGVSVLPWLGRVYEHLRAHYPDNPVVVDTSKSTRGLREYKTLYARGDIADVRAVLLVRDVRGWVLSERKNQLRKGRSTRTAFSAMRDWVKAQRQFIDELDHSGLPYRVISYESLIFKAEETSQLLGGFLGLDTVGVSTGLGTGESVVHDVLGNRMKYDASLRTRVAYDDDWQLDPWVNVLAPMIWPIWRLNTRLRRMNTPVDTS